MRLPVPPRSESLDDGPTTFERMRFWSVTQWLIAVNVAAFVADLLAKGAVNDCGEFSADRAIQRLQLWRILSFQFLHAGTLHLFFNMLWLYYLGPIVELRLGRGRYLAFYLLCGVAGPAMYLLLWKLGILISGPDVPMVGASAGIFGVMVAAMRIAPKMPVRLWLPPISLRLKTLVLIYVGIAALIVYSSGANAGGEAAHLGGAAAGFVLFRNVRWLGMFGPKRRERRFWRPGDPKSRFFRDDLD